MPDETQLTSGLPFGDFVEQLRRLGFTVGVAHHLRLHHLLAKVGSECSPEDLKTLLCPIFATDKNQQALFYDAFDQFFSFDRAGEAGDDATPGAGEGKNEWVPEPPTPSEKPKWLSRLTWAPVAGFVGFIFFSNLASPEWWTLTTGVDFTPTPIPMSATPTPVPSPAPEESWLPTLRLLAIILPPILLALYELYRFLSRRKRRRQMRERQQPSLPLTFRASASGIYDADSINRVGRLLRGRYRAGAERLDIGASIDATIKALGFLTQRHKAGSNPPEYLVLIDRASYRDHQARLFDELTARLRDEQVFLTRYFFEGDPRVCFNAPFVSDARPVVRSPDEQRRFEEEQESAKQGFHLEDLQDSHAGHRLIVFGDGEELVNPLTAETVEWVKTFAHWPDRAILSPRPPRRWGAHELALSTQFILLPATLAGLELLIESFALRETGSLPERLRGDKNLPPNDLDSENVATLLRSYLGEDLFQWLCACAVHPQLQWDLTLRLGALLFAADELLTEENILRLVRLPWFRTGLIPEKTRVRLVKELAPGKEAVVREVIENLSAEASVQKGTTALAPDLVAAIVSQEALDSRAGEGKAQRNLNLRDMTLARFLKPKPLLLYFKRILPDWLQSLLFTPFGLRAGARVVMTVLASVILWALFPIIADAIERNDPLDPTPTPTPISPTPTPQPTPSELGSPTPTPEMSPTATPTPSVSLSPTPTPTTTPTATPMPTPTLTPTPSELPDVPPGTKCVRIVGCPSGVAPFLPTSLKAVFSNYILRRTPRTFLDLLGNPQPTCFWRASPPSVLLPLPTSPLFTADNCERELNPEFSSSRNTPFTVSASMFFSGNQTGVATRQVEISVEGSGVVFARGCDTSDRCVIRIDRSGGVNPERVLGAFLDVSSEINRMQRFADLSKGKFSSSEQSRFINVMQELQDDVTRFSNTLKQASSDGIISQNEIISLRKDYDELSAAGDRAQRFVAEISNEDLRKNFSTIIDELLQTLATLKRALG
ncbi:MAG: hypothetical protein H7Z38_08170 [Rubrivivax sp.]|nr:hypothetical protein [Pyrinomonadaceae bacterium]